MSQSDVVFGAYGGIGSALCRRLAKKGARLLLAGRDEVRLATLASELGAECFCLDAANLRQVESCMKRALELHSPVDGVANCVGSLLLKPAHLLSEEEWDATVATNLKSAFAVVRAAAITMAQQGGSVALMSSAAARIGLANHEGNLRSQSRDRRFGARCLRLLCLERNSSQLCGAGYDPYSANGQVAAERNDG